MNGSNDARWKKEGQDEAAKNEGSRESGGQKKRRGEETDGPVNGRYIQP